MQQTENYKLNLIETSDPFSPGALNENAQKTEAALSGLSARTVTLENCRIVMGTYWGDSAAGGQVIGLGEQPLGVLVSWTTFYSARIAFASGNMVISCDYDKGMKITYDGFWVNDKVNIKNNRYSYFAFLGEWDEVHFPRPAD